MGCIELDVEELVDFIQLKQNISKEQVCLQSIQKNIQFQNCVDLCSVLELGLEMVIIPVEILNSYGQIDDGDVSLVDDGKVDNYYQSQNKVSKYCLT